MPQISNNQNSGRPLEGIRIVECAIWHAGPGASAILGDLGAEIIKIETLSGDPERAQKQLGAVKLDSVDMKVRSDWSLLFELSNRNKKGICLDTNTDKGRVIFHKLIESADVFLTNLRNSTKPRLGIDYESLKKINPKIIHASVSGFGTEGPLSDVGAFDPMGQAISGMLFLTGTEEPVLLQTVILDQATSITCSHAILTALLVREREGIGQEVHVSLYSAALWVMHANLLATCLMKSNPVVPWNRVNNSPLRNYYHCKDGNWIIGVNQPEKKYWKKFCEIMGQPQLYENPRYDSNEGRQEYSEELVEIFDKIFLDKTRDEWLEVFAKNGFMFAPVQKLEEVPEDNQALMNGYVVDFDHPLFGKTKLPGYPVQFSTKKAGTYASSPGLGEHTDTVLKELGYNDSEIVQLKKDKIIR